jgi:hypothetical protein
MEAEHDRYDLIVCVHVLQTLFASDVMEVFVKMANDLVPMGELHVHVPAMDFAAKKIIKSDADPIAFYMVYGSKETPFHCGFNLLWLRALATQAGMLVRSAQAGLFDITYSDRKVQVPEHVVVATVLPD